jgi:hypothetical protein
VAFLKFQKRKGLEMTDQASTIAPRPPLRRDAPSRQFVPHTVHLKEFAMADGRKILIDRRAVAFVCQRKEEPATQCIIAFKSGSAGVPVAAPRTRTSRPGGLASPPTAAMRHELEPRTHDLYNLFSGVTPIAEDTTRQADITAPAEARTGRDERAR